MKTVTHIPPTPRKAMTQPRASRIFVACNGVCYLCGNQIRAGEGWDVEHPDALALGGSDNDADLRVAHVKCHKAKTARDRAAMSKRDRLVTADWKGRKPKSRLSNSRFKQKMDGSVVDRLTGARVRP